MLLYSITKSTLHISTKDDEIEKIPENFFHDNFMNPRLRKSINEICISGKISSVGKRAFKNISGLRTIRLIPDVICSIASNAFSDNICLSNIQMNDNILSIGPSAFENCPTLRDIKFSQSLVIIGHRAFANDESLIDIYIPHTVDFCDKTAFDGTNIDQDYFLQDMQRSIECRNKSIETTNGGFHYLSVNKYKRGVN